ncbi:hypothetical protein TRIATDRAFT_321245 [Trichoderma atroviride IMI 206040]|uniref:Uncharacterized protein n=1 Tax=Hypocrea atroviridis (strain ATCC 20476 / IMI 206040) TaxID=452589 RepID=G9P8N5_HYPAI|nr:uncharacterized protein TRIATDRAFT_321245 [Trichoderma atroviride IMI 206040]EHK40971.1 hypothetical protein TRIATDRAFT_321245 [Trichoderma atroviride IMI 206040]
MAISEHTDSDDTGQRLPEHAIVLLVLVLDPWRDMAVPFGWSLVSLPAGG